MNKKFTLVVQWNGERFEVRVQELEISVSGVTLEEAVENAHYAINVVRAARMEAAKGPHTLVEETAS